MTNDQKLVAYQSRSPEYCLSSAIGYLTTALMYATRADQDLHWLSGADDYLKHAEAHIAEFRAFVAALNSDNESAADMVTAHKAKVDAACAQLGARVVEI